MEQIIGITIISIILLGVISLIFYLIKKNVFKSNTQNEISVHEEEILKKRDYLNKLKKENIDLNREIKFLEDKNKRLQIKVEKLKEIIKHLEEQKEQLLKSEKRLKELKAQKDDMLAMVAHDIKNPATAIQNFVELLESYDLTAQEQNDVLKGLVEISSRIVKLANEFSQVISDDFVHFDIVKKETNFISTVDTIYKANKVNADKKNIEIRLYQPQEELLVNVDEDKIKEVIDNYINNAIKYSPKESRVEIVTNKENNFVTLEVKDNGFGLTNEELEIAFEKGSKLSTKPTGDETSSGLGLWIAKKIVEQHDGKVWVKSKKGFGSTFAFSIPIK